MTIGNPAFCLALHLTGVHCRDELQRFGAVSEQKFKCRPTRTREIGDVRLSEALYGYVDFIKIWQVCWCSWYYLKFTVTFSLLYLFDWKLADLMAFLFFTAQNMRSRKIWCVSVGTQFIQAWKRTYYTYYTWEINLCQLLICCIKFYKPYSFRIHQWPNYMREKAKWKNCGSQLFPIYIKEEPKIEDNYLIV